MRSWIWALWLVAGLAALVVTVSTIALAVRQGSWSPILSMSWFPAVVVACATTPAAGGARPAAAGRGAPAGPPEPARAAVKNHVRAMRLDRSLAQGQLAQAMGVSRQTINSIENDRYTPSLPLAMALARYFGVTVEEMFDDQA